MGKEREGGGGGPCQDLRCLLRTPVSAGESAFPLPTCPPAVLTSHRRLPGSAEPKRAPIGVAAPPRYRASLPVVQQPFCQSPADPARCRSAVPPGYQVVGSSPPRCRRAGRRAPSERESAHHRRRLRSSPGRRGPSPEPRRCLPLLTTDRRPRGRCRRLCQARRATGPSCAT